MSYQRKSEGFEKMVVGTVIVLLLPFVLYELLMLLPIW